MSGMVNIARSVFTHSAFRSQKVSEREAFIWLIAQASWKDRRVRVGDVEVSLKRGQLAAAIRFMADLWKWEKSSVDRYLQRLKKRDMIATESAQGITVITLLNYDKYQGGASGPAPVHLAKRDTSGTAAGQTRIPDGIPEETNRSKGGIRLGQRLPDGWVLPTNWAKWAVEQGLTQSEAQTEAERFANHWSTVVGQTSIKRNWFAAWRSWIKFAKERKNAKHSPRHLPQSAERLDPALEQISRLARIVPSSGKLGL